MKRPSPLFQQIIFALLCIWFLLLAATFFIMRPFPQISILPDLLLLGLIIPAAYSIGSFITVQLRLEDILLPGEDFVLGTALGLGGLSLLTSIAGLLGLLNWWTVGLGLILAIAVGFYRIIGLVTPPTYLFGPEDLGEETPDPISWLQYIVIAILIIALANFCFLPPVFEKGLASTLGVPFQWVQRSGIDPDSVISPGSVSIPDGLYALGLALRGPHLAMLISGLLGGLAISVIYLCAKRYCGPLAARSTLLVAISLPLFSFTILAPSGALAVALYQFCAFFCTLRWFDENRRRWAVLGGIFVGLSLAGSATALLYIPPLLVSTFVWSIIKRRWQRFLLNVLISAAAAAITLIPWLVITQHLFGSPLPWAESLLSVKPLPLREGLPNMLLLPLSVSFPGSALPVWEVVGPIFLIFLPFFFITCRKNPASGLAVAVGLAFLAFCEPFGLSLEPRLVGLMLLALPTALAAHRFAEKGWQKKTAVIMLYLIIGWQIFHTTATIETIFPSPHRFLIGIESSEEFLEHAVPYYPVARYINRNLPANAHILVIGRQSLLYIERRVTMADADKTQEILELFDTDLTVEETVAHIRDEGYTYLLLNTSDSSGINSLSADSEWQSAMVEQLSTMLEERRIFQFDSVTLYTLLPIESEGTKKEN